MDTNAMHKFTYGLFVVTANRDGKDNGCITNTAIEVTSDPNRISVTINKSNLTCQMILDTGKFTVSSISQKAEFELFKHFGFQSGRDVDKFADFKDCRKAPNGTMIITSGTNAWISASVVNSIDLTTHIMFIADVTDSEVISDVPSATYEYYHSDIKPKPVKAGTDSEGQTIWRCTICGYEYVGEELPEDFVCPLCLHPASDFEKTVRQ